MVAAEAYTECFIRGANPAQRRQIRNAEPPTDPLAFLDISFYLTMCQNYQYRLPFTITIGNQLLLKRHTTA